MISEAFGKIVETLQKFCGNWGFENDHFYGGVVCLIFTSFHIFFPMKTKTKKLILIWEHGSGNMELLAEKSENHKKIEADMVLGEILEHDAESF